MRTSGMPNTPDTYNVINDRERCTRELILGSSKIHNVLHDVGAGHARHSPILADIKAKP